MKTPHSILADKVFGRPEYLKKADKSAGRRIVPNTDHKTPVYNEKEAREAGGDRKTIHPERGSTIIRKKQYKT